MFKLETAGLTNFPRAVSILAKSFLYLTSQFTGPLLNFSNQHLRINQKTQL